MGETTKIEWADHTFNPWIGCTKVSPACDFCYAEELMDTRYGRARWGAGEDRIRTGVKNWNEPRRWNKAAEAAGTRPFVFCASLADVFDNEVDPMWRRDLFALATECDRLVWLFLSKRVGNVLKMTDVMRDNPALPRNAAVGATMCNQEEYDRDAEKLREVKVLREPLFTFGSFEPLLGPIEMREDTAPDWVIVGGESGRSARTMEEAWAFDMMEDCVRMDRVFNFKQMGGRDSSKGGHTLGGQVFFDRPAVR